MDKNEIGVSILCLAYNHEQYIAEALEGFVKQKTAFPFEIIINEDASSDRTAEIIKEYEAKYPEIIRPIYHKENQYSKCVNINNEFMLPLARGKYVALCDGDDYWTDPCKLQKQFDALEAHPDCLMCLHKVRDFNALQGEGQDVRYLPAADINTGVIPSKNFFELLGQNDFFNEVCYFFNAEAYREYQANYPEFAQNFMKNKTDDAPMLYYFALKANVYYISDEMAVYRRFNAGSWSANMREKTLEQQSTYFKNILEAHDAFDTFSGGKYNRELTYARTYSSFNYERCQKHYKEMLAPEYDCVWERQSKKFRKRTELFAEHPKTAKIIFGIYDFVRANKR